MARILAAVAFFGMVAWGAEAAPLTPQRTAPPVETTRAIDSPPAEANPLGALAKTGIIVRDSTYTNGVPLCTDSYALMRISMRFSGKESGFWNSSLTLSDIDRIREVAGNAWGYNNIPARFCQARALLSDGRHRTLYYVIREDQGMIGAVSGVDACIEGLDRGWAYGARCSAARP